MSYLIGANEASGSQYNSVYAIFKVVIKPNGERWTIHDLLTNRCVDPYKFSEGSELSLSDLTLNGKLLRNLVEHIRKSALS